MNHEFLQYSTRTSLKLKSTPAGPHRSTTNFLPISRRPKPIQHHRLDITQTYQMAQLMNEDDPTTQLPRDKSGSYLHLKLKRFSSMDNLTMPYAVKSWRSIPHDAEVDMSPSNRSTCRQCHSTINKGELRVRLWLQCHKGCKMSAYFHGQGCVWQYPETIKLGSVEELVGFEKLRDKEQLEVKKSFLLLKDSSDEHQNVMNKKRKLNWYGSFCSNSAILVDAFSSWWSALDDLPRHSSPGIEAWWEGTKWIVDDDNWHLPLTGEYLWAYE